MGCAACLTEAHVQQPQQALHKIKGKVLAAELAHLTPTSLIPRDLFDKYMSLVHKHILKGQEQPDRHNLTTEQLAQPPPPTDNQLLLVKWKLLILCSGVDLYREEYDLLDESLQHGCFAQIQKDLDRTFPDQPLFLVEANQQTFKRLLKRLTLYFPEVGYTQGLNFIVGYLMIRGYDEHDTFWMVAHLALHPKYLLLGLFEDGFPLSLVYCHLFRFMFRSKLPKLYDKFQQMALADEIWIFKWFMTYYIYSFPFLIVREVWDAVIVLGGIGLVYFAVALVIHLEPRLTQLEDDVEVAAFFSNLKHQQSFFDLVDLDKVLRMVYEMKLDDSEIARETQTMKHNDSDFYVKFFTSCNDRSKNTELLKAWQNGMQTSRARYQEQHRKKLITGSYEALRFRPKHANKRKETKFKPKDTMHGLTHSNSRQRMTSSIYVVQLNGRDSNPPNSSAVLERLPTEQKEKEDEVVIFELEQPNVPSFKKKAEWAESSNTVNVVQKKISRVATEKNQEPSRKVKRVRQHSNRELSENSSSNKQASESRFEYCVGDAEHVISESVYEFSIQMEPNQQKIRIENVE